MTYDALLVLSFGGPEGPADVVPFLENVTRGRGVPPERLAGVAEHYQHFGGVSPINAQNRALIAAVDADLRAHGIELPIYWGNRNWHPYVEDTVRTMVADGVGRALVFVTSAYSSYSSCRQYQGDLAAACVAVGEAAPEFDKLRHFFDHPGFIEPQVDAVGSAVAGRDPTRRTTTRLVFTAHSIPVGMAEASGPDGNLYGAQLRVASELIATLAAPDLLWDLAFQSRSGPPSVPWLEPDVRDHLRALAMQGVTDVVVVPVGFVSDHLEVQWDLDVEAAAVATELGLGFIRTPTAGTHPRFVAMVRELVQERLDPGRPKRALSPLGPSHDACPGGCCPGLVRR
ncbi:MAG TPA: ferrochelatase [Mycobacteriales bacterium]|nr:ferrochelatase [Mycobacteriales bacterium]